jgi:hypothetical protein
VVHHHNGITGTRSCELHPFVSLGSHRLGNTLISTTGGCPSKKRVSKHIVWGLLIVENLVHGWKLSCKHGVKAGANTLLRSLSDSPLGTLQGYHPPGCSGLLIIWVSLIIIPEHYPIIPVKFTDVTYVGVATGHYGFWHFAIGHVYVGTKTLKFPLPVMDMQAGVLGSVSVLGFILSIIRTLLNYRTPIRPNYQF